MERAELLEHYKLAYAEYRAEVHLGWSRARFFLTLGLLGPALTVYVHSMRSIAVAAWVCAFGGMASLGGAFIVWQSHQRYRAARESLQSIAQQLSVPGFQTTGGMREAQGKPRGSAVRTSYLLAAMLVMVSALNTLLVFLPVF